MDSLQQEKNSYAQSPFIVIWETTRACALKCLHCRAEAIDHHDPDELSTEEAFRLLDEIRRFGKPLVVLTGGDPMRRPDAEEIIGYGTSLGLHVAMTPSATPAVTREGLSHLKERGLARLAVSLDGSTARIHDAFRGVEGSYAWTMNIVRWAHELEIPVQINTTVTKHNLEDIDSLTLLLERLGICLWSVFFLVPVGRAVSDTMLSASQCEKVFEKMFETARRGFFDVKSTEAPQYRRVVMQKRKGSEGLLPFGKPGTLRANRGVNDGNGFVFISHTGDIYPSGFLPVKAGNVREDSLVDVYRNSEIFKGLRDTSRLKGKCGVCEYRFVCGGSRARAFAMSGDLHGPEPLCSYVPEGYSMKKEEMKFW